MQRWHLTRTDPPDALERARFGWDDREEIEAFQMHTGFLDGPLARWLLDGVSELNLAGLVRPAEQACPKVPVVVNRPKVVDAFDPDRFFLDQAPTAVIATDRTHVGSEE